MLIMQAAVLLSMLALIMVNMPDFLFQLFFFCNNVVSFAPNSESYLKLLNEVSTTAVCEYEAINSALSHTSGAGALNLYCYGNTKICAERLAVIELLNAKVQCFSQIQAKSSLLNTLLRRIKSWVQ